MFEAKKSLMTVDNIGSLIILTVSCFELNVELSVSFVKCQMTVDLGTGSPQNLPVSCTPEMYADLCKCYVHTALSGRIVDQIVIPFTRNNLNRRPAVQNLNARIEANFVIKTLAPAT